MSERTNERTKPLRTLTSKLQHLRCQILQDGRGVHGGFGTDTDVVLGALFEVAVDTAYGELYFRVEGV